MMKSFHRDVMFAVESVKSVETFVPTALEIVIVVLREDEKLFRDKFTDLLKLDHKVKIIPIEAAVSDDALQQKFTKLHADLYCSGDYIMHVDSDVVFHREVLLRDIFWLGKPILLYQRYSTIATSQHTHTRWQRGTSLAMGRQIDHEYSRSSLHVYPRELYPQARAWLETVHRQSFVRFLSNDQLVRNMSHPDKDLIFSDFNFLGAYAHYERPQSFSLAPIDSDERERLPFPPPALPHAPTCQGNARLAHVFGKVDDLVKRMGQVRKLRMLRACGDLEHSLL
jgi:hypothetical protein